MESLYNKTALKKMKKDELVEAYLKLQGVHHEELQSNQELKDEIKLYCGDMTLEEFHDDLHQQMADNCDEYERETEARDEEIKKLKEEKKEGLDIMRDVKEGMEEMFEEIKKLESFKKEVIEAMKYDDDIDDEDIIEGISEMEGDIVGECELKEQIKKLKEQNEDFEELKEEKEELEETIEELKETTEDIFQQVADALCGKGDEADSICGWGHFNKLIKKATALKKIESEWDPEWVEEIEKNNIEFQEEIEKLQENLKQLQLIITTSTIDEARSARDKAQFELKELKEDLLFYRFYVYTLDSGADCELNKDDVDKFTDDEVQRKTLYDRIGYDPEEH